MPACVSATQTSSGIGYSSLRASSTRRRTLPTCGPLPCVTIELIAALDGVAQHLGRLAHLGELLVDRADLAGRADGVAAEGDDQSFADIGHE